MNMMKIEWLIEIVKKIREVPTEMEARGIFTAALDLEKEMTRTSPRSQVVDALVEDLGLKQKTIAS